MVLIAPKGKVWGGTDAKDPSDYYAGGGAGKQIPRPGHPLRRRFGKLILSRFVTLPFLVLAAPALPFAPFTASSGAAVIHVSPAGGPAGDGSQANPLDLPGGFAALDPGDTLRIAHGTYYWEDAVTGPISIPNGARVEGGFDASGSPWAKDLSNVTASS